MVSSRKLCAKENKVDCKVTFESTSKGSQVHNVQCTVCVCVCILTSLAVSGASALIPLPTPPPSREQGKDHSFFKVSLSSPPHHPIVWGRGREGAAPADRTTLLPRSSPPSHSPHPPTCFRGAVKPFLTLKNVFLLFCSSVLWFPSDHLHRLGSPSPPTPPSGLFFLTLLLFHPVDF